MKVNKKIIGRILAVVLAYALITFLIKGGVLNRQYTSLIVPIGVNIMLAVSLNLVQASWESFPWDMRALCRWAAISGALFTLKHRQGDLPSIIAAIAHLAVSLQRSSVSSSGYRCFVCRETIWPS